MDLGQLVLTTLAIAVSAIPLGLSVWALLDCARRPGWAWALADRSQAAWMATVLVGILVVPVGIAVSAWYLVRVRPVIAAAEDGRFRE